MPSNSDEYRPQLVELIWNRIKSSIELDVGGSSEKKITAVWFSLETDNLNVLPEL